MSDPRFLNDSQEFRHAGLIVSKTIREVAETHKKAWIDLGCRPDAFDEMVGNMCARFESLPIHSSWNSQNVGATPFIFSLSDKFDSLSQWRAYGKGEYCIGFDPVVLAQKAGGTISKIEYRDVEFYPDIEPILSSFFISHLVHTGERYKGGIDTEVRFSGADDFEGRLKDGGLFVRVKDPGFKEEQEWRLVKYVMPSGDVKIFFDDSGRYPVPRARVRIFDTVRDAEKIIKEVTCGPGADHAIAKQSFEMIHRVCGWAPKLKFSKVPFRAS